MFVSTETNILPPSPTISPIGATPRDILLMTATNDTVTTITGYYFDLYRVDHLID